MNIEEQLKQTNELLKKVLLRTYTDTDEETKIKQEEIEELDESIEKYQTKLDELSTKIADENNYKRTKSDFEVKERPIIEELLSDSIDQEREDLFKSNQSIRKEQEQQTRMSAIYNDKNAQLKNEIANIEARLNKDAIAKKRNIAKKLHLTEEEVLTLQKEIDYKKEQIEEGNQFIEVCANEFKRYSHLIEENNKRLNYIINKEQRLTTILCNKHENVSDIDRYQMRLDRDEICKIVSTLEALKKRKEYLLYNPTKEIKDQLKQNEEMLKSYKRIEEENKENKENEENLVSNDNPKNFEEPVKETKSMDEIINDIEKNKDKKTSSSSDSFSFPENLFTLKNNEVENEKDVSTPSTNSSEKAVEPYKEEPMELVSIEEPSPELKSQKTSNRIKQAWSNWRNKVIAGAIAAAVAITSGVGLFRHKNQTEDKNVSNEHIIEKTDSKENDDLEGKDFTFTNPIIPDSDEKNYIGNIENTYISSNNDEKETPKFTNSAIDKSNIEETKQEEVTEPIVGSTTSEIPEVEVEQPIISGQPNNDTSKEQASLNGVINNDEVETTILESEGEYVDIPLANGDVCLVKYGDNGENIPEEIKIKYDGTVMYIYSPIVHNKAL